MTYDSVVCAYCGTRLPSAHQETTGNRRMLVCSRCGKFLSLGRIADKKAMCKECERKFHQEQLNAQLREEQRKTDHICAIVAIHPELKDKIGRRLGVTRVDGSVRADAHAYSEICDWEAKVAHAKNLQLARRYEDAAVCYEQLGLWKEAGIVRDKKSSTTVKHVTINLNDLIDKLRAGGLSVPYKCTGCGATITIGKDSNPESLKFCSYCGSAMNVEMLTGILRDALR
jgi:DNA-directed RNA polymerase subunit RPC12/RpoP